MDLSGLFSVSGRYGRTRFWWSWWGLVVVSLVATWLPTVLIFAIIVPGVKTALGLFTTFSTLTIFYCQICINAKRLHDMGRSGWLQAIPLVVCFFIGIGGGTAARLTNDPHMVEYAGLLMFMIGLAFLLWIGFARSDKDANRFGPPTGRMGVAEAFA